MESRADYFNAIFERDDDPWRFRDSWYEQRKRDLTLAVLPLRHYRNAFEPGCANGELSAQLASRCDRLLSADIAPRAVELATRRLALFPHVSVELREMPRDIFGIGRLRLGGPPSFAACRDATPRSHAGMSRAEFIALIRFTEST